MEQQQNKWRDPFGTTGIVVLHTGICTVWTNQQYMQNMLVDSCGGCLDALLIVWSHQQSPREQVSMRLSRSSRAGCNALSDTG